MHFYEKPEDAKKLGKIVGGKIKKEIDSKESEHDKQEVFEAIDYLVSSACQLYCAGGLSWDETCKELSHAISKLEGKEDKLKEMADEPDEEEDGEES